MKKKAMRPVVMSDDAERLIAMLSGRSIPGEQLDEADWDRIITLARRHGVAQLLSMCFKANRMVPPPVVTDSIRAIYHAISWRNIRLFHELETIVEAFRTAGITVVPIKGAWLAELVYANIALRPMGDVDLWVQPDQFEAARQVMYSLGYSSRPKPNRPQAFQDALGGEVKMFKADAPMVEIHWSLFRGSWLRHTARIDEQMIWQRTLPYTGENVRQLCLEDAIIHVCVHLAVNHQMSLSCLRTLMDLQYARQRLNIDWSTLALRSRDWRVSSATWLVLQTLADMFGDPEKQLPLRDLAPSSLRRLILGRFVSLRTILEGHLISSGHQRFIFLTALVDHPGDIIGLLRQAVFPDRTWLKLRYGLQDAPQWRVWLQCLWHPFLVAFKKNI
jgi:hypothetical protein